MKYLLALFGDESRYAEATPEQMKDSMAAWDGFTKATIEAGVHLGGEGLQPSAAATTVKIEESGAPVVSDGPFAETKEQLAGYYLLDCANLDDVACLGQADSHARRHRGGPAGDGLRGQGLRGPQQRGRGRAVGPPPPRSTACSGASRGGRSPPSSACSATSTSPRRPCRTRSWWRWSAGRATGVPRNPAGVDRGHGPQRGHRPAAALAPLPGEAGRAGRARTWRGGRGGRGHELHPGRPPAAVLHLLSSGAVARGAGGADPAHARWPVHAGGGGRLPGGRDHDGPAPREGQAQDPGRRDPLRRARGLRPAGAPPPAAGRALPDLQRGLPGLERRHRRPSRAVRRGHKAHPRAGRADAG